MSHPPIWIITLSFLAFHLVLSALIPLVGDEMYYALWATAPSFGYYDHPPMIAWWIWLGEAVFGQNRFGVRFVSVISFALVTLMVWRLTWLITKKTRTADIAALVLNSTVLFVILGFTATPDSPSVFFWAAATWAIFEALYAIKPSVIIRWWIFAGICIGLGVQSKFTNLFFGVGLGGWLITTVAGRRWLFDKSVWISAFFAILMVGPLIWWNYDHNWLGLERQFGRISPHGFKFRFMLEFVVSAVFLLTPLIAWAYLAGVCKVQGSTRLVIWLTVPLLIYFIYHSTHAQVQSNWLLPIFPGAAVLAAIYMEKKSNGFVWASASLGLGISLIALILAFWPGAPLTNVNNPPNQTRGWDTTINQFRELIDESNAEWVATSSYGLTGSISFYLPETNVWAISEIYRYGFRGSFPDFLCSAPGLVILEKKDQNSETMALFAKTGSTTVVLRTSHDIELGRYFITPFKGLMGPQQKLCGSEDR